MPNRAAERESVPKETPKPKSPPRPSKEDLEKKALASLDEDRREVYEQYNEIEEAITET